MEGEGQNSNNTETNENTLSNQEEQQVSNTDNSESSNTANNYYVTNANAKIRVNAEPHNAFVEGNLVIAKGTKVILQEIFNGDRAKVQYANDSSQTVWTSLSNLGKLESFNDSELYTAFYNDIAIYSNPGAEVGNTKLEANKKYQIINKVESVDGNYYEVKKEGENTNTGWKKDYQFNLFKGTKVTRHDELKKYKTWLEARYTEALSKEGDDKISFVQGILYQAEIISENIEKDPPQYPNTETLSKTPSFEETINTAKDISVPHELISTIRKFVEITEFKPTTEESVTEVENVTSSSEQEANTSSIGLSNETISQIPSVSSTASSESTNTPSGIENRIVGGSRYSNIDWNTRLKVPQYRTQSDNMSVPEATCAPTSFAIAIERLGHGRDSVIAAIEAKLSDGVLNQNLTTLWESKSKEYLEKVSSTVSENYQKLRGNKGGLIGKEDELSKKFKVIAKMEDLLDFYKYLYGGNPSARNGIYGWSESSVELNRISKADFSSSDVAEFEKETPSAKWNPEIRNKIKDVIDKGGTVVLNIKHKGTESNGHLITVQSITSEGLIVDDLYGGHNQDYRQWRTGDLYIGKGFTSGRENYDYKNVNHYDKDENDYTKRDFTAEAGQNIESNESRGNSVLLTYTMLNECANFINGIYFYSNK